MTDERAKLSVSEAQATVLRCFDKRPRSNGAIHDTISGVTIMAQERGALITVPRGKDYSQLIHMRDLGMFSVASGKLENTIETVTGVSVDLNGMLNIEFSGPVTLAAATTPADLVTIMNGEVPVVLSVEPIVAEPDNNWGTTKIFDITAEDLTLMPTLTITLGTGVTLFEDPNGIHVPAHLTIYTLT